VLGTRGRVASRVASLHTAIREPISSNCASSCVAPVASVALAAAAAAVAGVAGEGGMRRTVHSPSLSRSRSRSLSLALSPGGLPAVYVYVFAAAVGAALVCVLSGRCVCVLRAVGVRKLDGVGCDVARG